jgi:hypothetical protein
MALIPAVNRAREERGTRVLVFMNSAKDEKIRRLEVPNGRKGCYSGEPRRCSRRQSIQNRNSASK